MRDSSSFKGLWMEESKAGAENPSQQSIIGYQKPYLKEKEVATKLGNSHLDAENKICSIYSPNIYNSMCLVISLIHTEFSLIFQGSLTDT